MSKRKGDFIEQFIKNEKKREEEGEGEGEGAEHQNKEEDMNPPPPPSRLLLTKTPSRKKRVIISTPLITPTLIISPDKFDNFMFSPSSLTPEKMKLFLKSRKNKLKSYVQIPNIVQQLKTLKQKGSKKLLREKLEELAEHVMTFCKDVGICFSLNVYQNEILRLFEAFKTFDFLIDSERIISNSTANGVIRILKYQNHFSFLPEKEFEAFAILKIPKSQKSDNLSLEFVNGNAINQWTNVFPIFIHTYGLFYIHNDKNFKTSVLMQPGLIPKESFLENVEPLNMSTLKGLSKEIQCQKIDNVGLLGQFYSRVISLRAKIASNDANFMFKELPFLLFQLYHALSILKDEFTHYDLHDQNVLLVPLDGYVEWEYSFKGSIITFQSQYLIKIIDYGRSFTKEGKKYIQYLKKICKEDYPNQSYGIYVNQMYSVNPTKSNWSHDLRLIRMVSRTINVINPQNYLYNDIESNLLYNMEYGTMQIDDTNRDPNPSKLYQNINDIYNILGDYCIGDRPDLDIFSEDPMDTNLEYIESLALPKLGTCKVYNNPNTSMKFLFTNDLPHRKTKYFSFHK